MQDKVYGMVPVWGGYKHEILPKYLTTKERGKQKRVQGNGEGINDLANFTPWGPLFSLHLSGSSALHPLVASPLHLSECQSFLSAWVPVLSIYLFASPIHLSGCHSSPSVCVPVFYICLGASPLHFSRCKSSPSVWLPVLSICLGASPLHLSGCQSSQSVWLPVLSICLGASPLHLSGCQSSPLPPVSSEVICPPWVIMPRPPLFVVHYLSLLGSSPYLLSILEGTM